jgi:hypothetical protein
MEAIQLILAQPTQAQAAMVELTISAAVVLAVLELLSLPILTPSHLSVQSVAL